MYEGQCYSCWYFQIEDEQPEEDKVLGKCTDKTCFSRYNTVVDGNIRRACYKNQTDILRGGKSYQMKLF